MKIHTLETPFSNTCGSCIRTSLLI